MKKMIFLSMMGLYMAGSPVSAAVAAKLSVAACFAPLSVAMMGDMDLYYDGRRIGYITSSGDIYLSGRRVGEIRSGGDIYRDGRRVGEVRSSGDIYRDGRRVGEVRSSGDVYRDGRRVGEVRSNGDVYRDGRRIGRVSYMLKPQWAAIIYFFDFFGL